MRLLQFITNERHTSSITLLLLLSKHIFVTNSQVDIGFYEGQSKIDVSDYNPSREWELVSQSGKKNEKYYSCCAEPYPDLTFTLKIRRTENFYTHTYIGPTIIISLIIPGIFALPVTGLHRYLLGEWTYINGTILHYTYDWATYFKSLAPGRCGYDLISLIRKLISRIGTLSIAWLIAHRWMSQAPLMIN